MFMKSFFDTLYIGGYYFACLLRNLLRLTIEPVQGAIVILIYEIFPSLQRKLEKQGTDAEEEAERTIQMIRKIDDADPLHQRESLVESMLFIMFFIVGFDIIFIIWHLCGKSFAFIPLGRIEKAQLYLGLSLAFTYVIMHFGFMRDDNEKKLVKKFKSKKRSKKGKKELKKSLLIFIGSYLFVGCSFFELLWGTFGILDFFGV